MESKSGSEKTVHQEKLRLSGWILIIIFILYAAVITALVSCAIKGLLLIPIVLGVLLVLLSLTFGNFSKLFFEITDKEVRFGFGLINKVFERKDIISCEPFELTFKNYMGYGIRLGMDGTVAYNTRSGTGVKIVVDGQKRPYVVSLDNPEEVCRLLTQAQPTD